MLQRVTLALALLGFACATGPENHSEDIGLLAGAWDETACVITGTTPPHRVEECLGAQPDRLTVSPNGAWIIHPSPGLPGEDDTPAFAGTFKARVGALWADYEIGASFRVTATPSGGQMTWQASAPYTFVGRSAEEPATIALSWVRDTEQPVTSRTL